MVSKEKAQEAYKEKRVRQLFVIEGAEAKKAFLPMDRIMSALNGAQDKSKCFVVWGEGSFGLYEMFDKKDE